MHETDSILTTADRAELSAQFGEAINFDAPLAPLTWWRVGGLADGLLEVVDEAALAAVLEFCRRRRMPWFIMGNASNILVGDGGIRGLVFRLGPAFQTIDILDDASGSEIRIVAGGGASLAALTGQAASRGALGVDGLAGVPATLGGAVRMNAGTDHEIGEFTRRVWVQSLSRPEPHDVTVQYLYRRSSLDPQSIITKVELSFAQGDVSEVRASLQDRLVRRKATQPVAQPNAGSCFRNPPGDRAGRLIESVGAKGWQIGQAMVSPLHANFIVNLGGATACDIARLLARVRAAVLEQTQVELVLEVHFVGVFTAFDEPHESASVFAAAGDRP